MGGFSTDENGGWGRFLPWAPLRGPSFTRKKNFYTQSSETPRRLVLSSSSLDELRVMASERSCYALFESHVLAGLAGGSLAQVFFHEPWSGVTFD